MNLDTPSILTEPVFNPVRGLAWKWPLAHTGFFTAFVVADWFFDEIYLPKNHSLISLPVLLGLLQWALTRGCLRQGYFLPIVNMLGVCLSFLGVWIFPALIGLGLGLAQAMFFRIQGYRRTVYWIVASFCGWVFGAIAWGFLNDAKESFPANWLPLVDPLLQPMLGAGIGYGLVTALALGLLKKKAS